ncbi:hypothetical protein [Nonomuraea africana]|uniref:Uncharacterized protein n=1 Tax=Nonomuraea africana TaxID=46171 RepID=A0ABR9KRX3_9ACTN|nr:hypothetical protein [Nonomuraea africana]MBE1564782.1 hypothetical protein [Nonomuraea africana]
MNTRRAACAELIVFTDDELARLDALPDPAHELEPAAACELEAGHEGPHLALGQTSGFDDEWWIRFRGDVREFVTPKPCLAETPDESWRCGLPQDHPGVHTFELSGGT